ncbi:GPI ethanolamine phosphate transferase 2 [Manis javanica]|nr:GPI ethanolamine phosphate transferase 2 [Manis javanica]
MEQGLKLLPKIGPRCGCHGNSTLAYLRMIPFSPRAEWIEVPESQRPGVENTAQVDSLRKEEQHLAFLQPWLIWKICKLTYNLIKMTWSHQFF